MKSTKRYTQDYLSIILGSFILALAVSLFLVPYKISTGGISGIATVIYYFFEIPLSVTTLVINLLLFAVGFHHLPRQSLVKTLVGVVAFSLFLYFADRLTLIMPQTVAQITDDIWLASIFGGVLSGVGVGLVVKRDASTGGSDFAALMLKKLVPHISVGTFIMIIDTSIIITSGIAFSDLRIMLYSLVSLYICAKITDLIIISGETARRVDIISDRSSEIAARIMSELERGVTAIHASGCFEDTEREILMCIVSIKEMPRVVGIVREIDRGAFLVTSEAKEVRGLGFKEEANFDYNARERKK